MEMSKRNIPFELGKRYKVLGQQDQWFTIDSIQLNKNNEIDYFMGKYDGNESKSMLSGSRLSQEKKTPFLADSFTNILAIGNWNTKIFTPEWVKNKVFELPPEEKMFIQVNHDELRFGYEYNDVFIIADDNTLEFVIKNGSDETIELATIFLLKILNLLPHTPLRAIGFNFNADTFNYESKLIEQINSMFAIRGSYHLKNVHFVEKRDKYVINISANEIPDGLRVNFNFHYYGLIELTDKVFVQHREEINQFLAK